MIDIAVYARKFKRHKAVSSWVIDHNEGLFARDSVAVVTAAADVVFWHWPIITGDRTERYNNYGGHYLLKQ